MLCHMPRASTDLAAELDVELYQGRPCTFRITTTGTGSGNITVLYTVTGTATVGVDYTSLGTSITFPAGSGSVSRLVTPRQDSLLEGSETVIVTMIQSTGYAVGNPVSATVTLLRANSET